MCPGWPWPLVATANNRPYIALCTIVSACETSRCLLEEVGAFEQAQFPSDDVMKAPPLRFDSFDHRLSDTQRIVSLSMVLFCYFGRKWYVVEI